MAVTSGDIFFNLTSFIKHFWGQRLGEGDKREGGARTCIVCLSLSVEAEYFSEPTSFCSLLKIVNK